MRILKYNVFHRFRLVFSLIFIIPFLMSATPAWCQTNFYESQEIKKKIIKDFKELIDIWTEELYFEMYQFGTTRSRKRLQKIEFVQRLVDLHWKPSLKPIKDDNVTILYRNFAIIEFTQEFTNKFDLTRTVEKRMVFPTILEGSTWKIDLTQLINVPYEGRVAEKMAAKKKPMPDKADKAAKDSTTDATSDATSDQAAP